MRLRSILLFTTFFLTRFTVAVWSQPLPIRPNDSSNPAVENQFLSGKISSVGHGSFAVDVVKNSETQQTVKLLLNDKTEVQGELTIGAQVTVEYRADEGKNVALRVVVTT